MTQTRILLIRHGETAWNTIRRLQGHIDIALNEAGVGQALALGKALSKEQLNAIESSDLQRAMQTAQTIVLHHDEMVVLPNPQLRERAYGAFEGLLYPQIQNCYPSEFASWQARDLDAMIPTGKGAAESFRQFYDRVIGALKELGVRYPNQTVAVITHGGVLECAYREAQNNQRDGPRDFEVKNASINRFELRKGKLRLISWGEAEHLAQPWFRNVD